MSADHNVDESTDSMYTVAPPPFNQPSADVTLRTPDHVDFHVHTHVLSQASPVFADMFSLPQPPRVDEHSPGLSQHRPIVDITEDSKTLERLLRLCYPINKQHLGELDDIVPVLKAATKYEMEWPVSLLANGLLAVAPKSPLKVWAVACQTGLEEVAHKAACAMRERAAEATQCLPVLETLLKEEGLTVLSDICAGDYFRLREFLRRTATDQSFKLLNQPSWSLSSNFLSGFLSTLQPTTTRSRTQAPALLVPASHKTPKRPHRRKLSVPSNPAPDLVMQCQDGGQIFVHQIIVSLHSAPLRAQLEAAQEEGSTVFASSRGLSTPVSPARAIHVDLDSRTLTALLMVLYEGDDCLPSDLRQLATILIAAQKYGFWRVVRVIEARWEKEVVRSPLEAYFVAVQHGLKENARGAARNVLQKPLAGCHAPSMEDSSALAYHRLLVYYDSCARVVIEQIDQAISNWNTATSNVTARIYCGSSYVNTPSQTWMTTYLQGLKAPEALALGPERTSVVTTHELLRKACSYPSVWPNPAEKPCQSIGNGLLQAGSALPKAITDAIAKVELEL